MIKSWNRKVKNLFGIANETLPLVTSGDLCDELSSKVSLKTSLAKRARTFVAENQFTALGTPPDQEKKIKFSITPKIRSEN